MKHRKWGKPPFRKKTKEDGCPFTGKIIFLTQSAAYAVGLTKGRRYGVRYDVYECPHCNFWHLTTVQRLANPKAEQATRAEEMPTGEKKEVA